VRFRERAAPPEAEESPAQQPTRPPWTPPST
jgi:hypothetical protein